MEMVIFIIIELFREWLVTKTSCIVRNGIALAMPVLFLLMLLIKSGNRLLMVLPVVSLIWCIVAGHLYWQRNFPADWNDMQCVEMKSHFYRMDYFWYIC